MNPSRWNQAHSILCIRLDNLGDVLMTTPAMRALKHSLPGCHITLLASRSGAAGACHIPEVDEAIAYAPPWMKNSLASDPGADLDMVHVLRSHRFDAAVIFTAYSQSALPAAMLCHLAKIPLRLAHCRENPYHLLTDWMADPEPHEKVRHEVRRQLDLVASVGCATNDERLSFSVPHGDIAWARRHLTTIGIDLTKPWLLLHPGATAPSRRYPPKLWAEALNRLSSELQCPIVFAGGAGETALVEQIRDDLACPSYSLAGKLDLGRFAAVVALAPVLLSNNSGPAHLAAAVGTPVVDLYALTNFQHTPWKVPNRVLYHDVPCAPCYKSVCPQGHHDCLEKVSPARVAQETISLLEETWAGIAEKKTWGTPAAEGETLQPLFPQRPLRSTGRKDAALEPLTPIVIRSANPAADAMKNWSKGKFNR